MTGSRIYVNKIMTFATEWTLPRTQRGDLCIVIMFKYHWSMPAKKSNPGTAAMDTIEIIQRKSFGKKHNAWPQPPGNWI